MLLKGFLCLAQLHLGEPPSAALIYSFPQNQSCFHLSPVSCWRHWITLTFCLKRIRCCSPSLLWMAIVPVMPAPNISPINSLLPRRMRSGAVALDQLPLQLPQKGGIQLTCDHIYMFTGKSQDGRNWLPKDHIRHSSCNMICNSQGCPFRVSPAEEIPLPAH